MNYLIQRGKVRNQMINVPQGLPELLSDITREVLRCQPTSECLCQFIIDYLHSLIITREKARVAKGIIDRALAVVDEIIADMCVCDISEEKAHEMALHMEECFRRFLSRMRCEQRKEIEIVRFEEQDMLDAMVERCKFTEQELKISKPMIEAAYRRFVDAYMKAHEDIEGTEELYQYFKERERMRLEEEKEKMAATKIQANYRGYRVRKNFGKPAPQEVSAERLLDEQYLLLQNQAAITIQKAFRRYLSSLQSEKSMEKGGEICEPGSKIKVAVPGAPDDITTEPLELAEEDVPLEAAQQTEAAVVLESQVPPTEPEPKTEPETEAEAGPEPEPSQESQVAAAPTTEVEVEPLPLEPGLPEPARNASAVAVEDPAAEGVSDAATEEAPAEG
ncbi:GATA type zinc finger protein asd-4 [Ceratitis capitata]|uniref:GATA type zinc finger protein asd-4 n=1 Tax=Ceratitis capitata TaxID=7213 RepID=UPI00061881A5|nr:GATA type zinc finger protein asd-4 [Ceratitis capitata]